MKRKHVLARMKGGCLITVVHAKDYEQDEKVVDVIIEDGINFIELIVTMDEGDLVEPIKMMVNKYENNGRIVIGAGIVLDPETVRACTLAGTNYIVGPGLNIDTIKLCNRYRVLILPGVATPAEATTALEAGYDIIKVFSGSITGSAAVSSFKGPFPQGEFMPSDGVDASDVDKWIKVDAYAVGIGPSLTKGVKTNGFVAVTAGVQEFVAVVTAART